MKIPVSEVNDLIVAYIRTLGFSPKESALIAENFLEAELAGKKSHGLANLIWYKRAVTTGSSGYTVNVNPDPVRIIKQSPVSLYIDGMHKTGLLVMREALTRALVKVKKSYIVVVGISNTAPSTGYVGFWARMATQKNVIFMCWNNSNGRNAPHGSTQRLYGTDPITIGIPTNGDPIILDMATSKITVGQLMSSQITRTPLPPESAIDAEGNYSTDADIVWDKGALTFIAGHKGSGLAFVGEMLAGALTASRVGHSVPGGWGTFFILIDPTLFRPRKEFKRDIDTAITELKTSKKRIGVSEIFYPGERSLRKRLENLKSGALDIDEKIYRILQEELRSNK